MLNKQLISVVMTAISLAAGDCLSAEGDKAMATQIEQQLQSAGRDQYDEVKDPGRQPVATMQFFGVKAGMTVLDAIAGAGYNTEILSAAVGPDGIVYAQNSHLVLRLINGAHHKSMLSRLDNDGLPNVRYMVMDAEDLPFSDAVDMAFWGFNMHDIYNSDGQAATLLFLRSLKKALKPGGVLAVSDHVGDAGHDNAELHRLEPRIILDMIEKAGFSIDATSNLLANPDDDHSQSIYADGLRYHTDRILVRARKPQ